MKDNGWLKLHRKIMKNPMFKEENLFRLWIVLLCLANHTEHDYIINGEKIRVKAGQLVTSRRKLAEYLDIDDNAIDRLLRGPINGPTITQVCHKKYRVITILKWNRYQFIHTIPSQKAGTYKK